MEQIRSGGRQGSRKGNGRGRGRRVSSWNRRCRRELSWSSIEGTRKRGVSEAKMTGFLSGFL